MIALSLVVKIANIESQELIWFEIFPNSNHLTLSTFKAITLRIDVIVILVSIIFMCILVFSSSSSAFAWNKDKGCFKQGKATLTLLIMFDEELALSWQRLCQRASTSLANLFFSADKTHCFANFLILIVSFILSALLFCSDSFTLTINLMNICSHGIRKRCKT